MAKSQSLSGVWVPMAREPPSVTACTVGRATGCAATMSQNCSSVMKFSMADSRQSGTGACWLERCSSSPDVVEFDVTP